VRLSFFSAGVYSHAFKSFGRGDGIEESGINSRNLHGKAALDCACQDANPTVVSKHLLVEDNDPTAGGGEKAVHGSASSCPDQVGTERNNDGNRVLSEIL